VIFSGIFSCYSIKFNQIWCSQSISSPLKQHFYCYGSKNIAIPRRAG